MPQAPKKPRTPRSESLDAESNAWSKDQENRGYYYDDAHGYEVYHPEEETDDELDDKTVDGGLK